MKLTSPEFGAEEISSLEQCLKSGWVTQGPMTAKFERMFAERHCVGHALACTSCTAALHMAVWALDIGPGDEVIVPAFTWISSANCVEFVGAKPVFVDVRPGTFNLDPDAVAAAITSRTRAIMAVHLFGLPAEMDTLNSLALRHGLFVVEDAACAVGSTCHGRPVGSHGNPTCFSFHPRKVITTGEGGMLTTNDSDFARRVSALRSHGSTGLPPGVGAPKPYIMDDFPLLGNNYRLSDIQAAIGVAQMGRLEKLLDERLRLAQNYLCLLADLDDMALPETPEGYGHTYQSFVLRLLEGGKKRRDRIMDHLAACDIQTRPGTHAVHRLAYYADKYGLKPDDFPVAAASEDLSLTIPVFPGMTDADQDKVARALREALSLKV